MFCDICLPRQTVDSSSYISDRMVEGKMFWVGYLLCDPKDVTSMTTSKYDMSPEDVRRMDLEGVPVIYNHNKRRKPLGRVLASWHDHDFPNALFAVAFLAVIDNTAVLQTPACITTMGDSFASLSTLEADRSKACEVSITFCGARDGTAAMFVSSDRVYDTVQRFGLSQASIDASRGTGIQMEANCVPPVAEQAAEMDFESVMKCLPDTQYAVIKERLDKEQTSLNAAIDEAEGHKGEAAKMTEAVALLSDYMSSMIRNRIALEQGSTSDMADKRRKDFEMMKGRGVFDGNLSDLEAIRKMAEYCRECFQDGDAAEKDMVDKFCRNFDDSFPHFSNRLAERAKSISTVDAAFNLIKEDMISRELTKMEKERDTSRQKLRAFEVAKKQYDVLDAHEKSPSTDDHRRRQPGNMSYEQFLHSFGISDTDADDCSPPPAKKRRMNDDDGSSDDNLVKYAVEKEKEYLKMQKRFKSYEKDYHQHKHQREENHAKRLDDLAAIMPTLAKMAENFEKKRQTNEQPKQVEAVATAQQSDIQQRTVDASKTDTNVVLFDL